MSAVRRRLKLRFFGGLNDEEAAEVSVFQWRDWDFVRTRLGSQLR